MDKLIKIVKWSIIAIIVIIVLFDVVLEVLGYTISEAMRDWESLDGLWFAPYVGATILGHWWIHFWKSTNRWIEWVPYRYLVLVGIGVLTIVLNVTISTEVLYLPWYVTIPGGLATGALLWPQLSRRKQEGETAENQ
ncbi:MAG: hypothetical protein ACWGQW_03880 [bacterium]